MITAVKQTVNTVLMYIYLIYYTERLRHDRKFRISESFKELKRKRRSKVLQYERDFKWKI